MDITTANLLRATSYPEFAGRRIVINLERYAARMAWPPPHCGPAGARAKRRAAAWHAARQAVASAAHRRIAAPPPPRPTPLQPPRGPGQPFEAVGATALPAKCQIPQHLGGGGGRDGQLLEVTLPMTRTVNIRAVEQLLALAGPSPVDHRIAAFCSLSGS